MCAWKRKGKHGWDPNSGLRRFKHGRVFAFLMINYIAGRQMGTGMRTIVGRVATLSRVGTVLCVIAISAMCGGFIYLGVAHKEARTLKAAVEADTASFSTALASAVSDLEQVTVDVEELQNTTAVIADLVEKTMDLMDNHTLLAVQLDQLRAVDAIQGDNITSIVSRLEVLETTSASTVTRVDTLETTAADLVQRVEVLEQAVLYTPGTEIIAYVSSSGSAGGECTVGDHCTLDRAIAVLGTHKATRCIIQVEGAINLGLNPSTCFFPVMERCKHVIIRGRIDNDVRTSAVASGAFGPVKTWVTLTVADTLGVNTYARGFVWNAERGKHYAVSTNAATTANVVSAAADWSGSDDLTFFTLSSTIGWSGMWKLDIPFGFVRFETIYLEPRDRETYFSAVSESSHRVEFHGCMLGCASNECYAGSLTFQGCYVRELEADSFLLNPDFQQDVLIESLYVDESSLLLSGPSKAKDISLNGAVMNARAGDVTIINLLISLPPAGIAFNLYHTCNVIVTGLEISKASTAVSVFGGSTATITDANIGCTGTCLFLGASAGCTVRGTVAITGPNPVVVEESSIDMKGRITITRSSGIATSLVLDKGSTARLDASASAKITFVQASGSIIRVTGASTAILSSTAGAFVFSTGGVFVEMLKLARVIGGTTPTNLGAGGLLSLCNSGVVAWATASAAPGCDFST